MGDSCTVGSMTCSFLPEASPRQGQRSLAQGNALGCESPLITYAPLGAMEPLPLQGGYDFERIVTQGVALG
jgi:hypothetical protein